MRRPIPAGDARPHGAPGRQRAQRPSLSPKWRASKPESSTKMCLCGSPYSQSSIRGTKMRRNRMLWPPDQARRMGAPSKLCLGGLARASTLPIQPRTKTGAPGPSHLGTWDSRILHPPSSTRSRKWVPQVSPLRPGIQRPFKPELDRSEPYTFALLIMALVPTSSRAACLPNRMQSGTPMPS